MQWPPWWEWELELTPHVERRKEDRDFSEVDLRRMLESAVSHRPEVVEGRFVIGTRLLDRRWEIIVEPDDRDRLPVVITAYAVD